MVVSENNFQQYITYFNNFLTEVLLSLSGHCFGAPDLQFTGFIFYTFTFYLIHLIICSCGLESLNKIFSTFNIFERPITVWKVSKYGVISGPYFPVLGLNTEKSYLSVLRPNTGKYEPEINPYLDTFHAVPLQKILHIC